MTDFVRPTTANPTRQFYAVCTTCGWQVYSRIFRGVRTLAEQHTGQCADAAVEVDLVQYIGHEKTPAELQLDEGHGNHLSAGASMNTTEPHLSLASSRE